MPSLREYRRKIKSVKSTQQITKAMKMVATARLRKAQQRILSARPFAQKMEDMMNDLLARAGDKEERPLTQKRPSTKRLLLLVTSDKGLCGAFNTNLIREGLRYLRKHGSGNVGLLIVGRKGRDYFRRMQAPIVKEYVQLSGAPTFAQAELMFKELLDLYQDHSWGGVDIIYNEFKSLIQQRLVVKPLLPLALPEDQSKRTPHEFIYEPSRDELLVAFVERYLKSQIFRVLLESSAAELGARMSAMDNATRNAADSVDTLTLYMNRTRQASITKEILEVVSGAEALK